MEKINERFYQIRKSLHLSQADMGNAIGISASGVSNIEKGIRSVTKKHVRLLSATFNVDESWLETGMGEMFCKNDDNIISQLTDEYKLTDSQAALIRSFLSLNNEQREAVVTAVCNAAKAIEEAKAGASEKESKILHQRLDEELYASKRAPSASTSGSSGTDVAEEKDA